MGFAETWSVNVHFISFRITWDCYLLEVEVYMPTVGDVNSLLSSYTLHATMKKPCTAEGRILCAAVTYNRQCPALGTGALAQIAAVVRTQTLSFCSCTSTHHAGPSPLTSWTAREPTCQQTLLHGSWDPWAKPPSGGSTSKYRKKSLWRKLNACFGPK